MAKARDRALGARHILATNIKRLRSLQGLSQERLAALARLHPNYVGSVEREERNISIDNIEKITAALGASVSALLSAADAKGR
jgi:transcriptional regulator with XRE-family HTH domain